VILSQFNSLLEVAVGLNTVFAVFAELRSRYNFERDVSDISKRYGALTNRWAARNDDTDKRRNAEERLSLLGSKVDKMTRDARKAERSLELIAMVGQTASVITAIIALALLVWATFDQYHELTNRRGALIATLPCMPIPFWFAYFALRRSFYLRRAREYQLVLDLIDATEMHSDAGAVVKREIDSALGNIPPGN